MKQSLLQQSLELFGLSNEAQQKAMLENMFFEGLFAPEEVWKSLNQMPQNFGPDGKTNIEGIFTHMMGVMAGAGALQENPKLFRPGKVLDRLFGQGCPPLDVQDVQDWLLFSKQTSYGRSINMERFDLPKDERITGNDYVATKYTENASIIGMINEVRPQNAVYDEAWVQGASRLRIQTRLDFLVGAIESGEAKIISVENGVEKPGIIRMVSGKRPVYAPLDGIGDNRVEEGGQYLLRLAEDLGVPYNRKPPFLEKRSAMDKPLRYVNYTTERQLTESDIAQDIFDKKWEECRARGVDLGLVNTTRTLENGTRGRPDAGTTSAEAADRLVERIKAGKFGERKDIRILNVADQPYIPRMHVQVQDVINLKLRQAGLTDEYTVTVETIGEKCRDNLDVAKSDSAALALHQYRHVVFIGGQDRKRPEKSLTSDGRDKTKEISAKPTAISFVTERKGQTR